MEDILLTLGCLTIAGLLIWGISIFEKYINAKPIVMVCRVKGSGDLNRIGVVLFEDFVKSSRNFWEWRPQSLKTNVERVSVSPIFVFEAGNLPGIDVLLENCRVQEGIFNVPFGPYDQLAAAYEHIHKRPFDFQLIANK